MKVLSKKIFAGNKLYLIMGVIFFTLNSILTLTQVIQQDEVGTILNIKTKSLCSLFEIYYSGFDTQVPLYFIIVYYIGKVLFFIDNQIYVLRLFSLIFSLIGIYYLWKIFLSLKIKKFFNLFLLILSTVNYFFSYYLTTARPYALFFCLFSISFFYFLKLNFAYRNSDAVLFTLSLIALIYTHYYGIIYVTLYIFPIFFNSNLKKEYRIKIFVSILVSILSIIPWNSAIQNQLNNHNMIIYHEIPSFWDALRVYFIFFRYLVIFILPIILLGVFKFFIKGDSDKLFYIIILLSLIFLVPFLNYLVTKIGFTVFADRYFAPTYIFTLVYFFYLISSFSSILEKVPSWIIILIFLFIFIHRFTINYSFQQYRWAKISTLTKILGEENLLTESAQEFFPLYYNSSVSEKSNLFLILDYESANKDTNRKSSLFDYYGCNKIKKLYNIPNIIEYDNLKLDRSYWILDEDKKSTFPTLLLEDGFKIDNRLSKGIYRVSRK